jgi:hypothetical protein
MRSSATFRVTRNVKCHPAQIRRVLLVLALCLLTWVLLFSEPSRHGSTELLELDVVPVVESRTTVLLSPPPTTGAPHIPCAIPEHYYRRADSATAVEYVEDIVDLGPPDKDCVVYTVFVGTYEKTLKPYADQTMDCYWVAFTDRMDILGYRRWIIRPIPKQFLRDNTSTVYKSSWHRGYAITKFVKMLPFLLFPSFIKHALYIDGDFHVINSMAVQRAIKTVVASNAPILFRSHGIIDNLLEELHQCSARYKAVGTLHLLVKDYLAHVAEGLCDRWYDMAPSLQSIAPVGPPLRSTESLGLLAAVLNTAFCFGDSRESNATTLALAQRFLYFGNNLTTPRYACRREPNRTTTTLPMLDEELLRGIPQPSGPHVPLYDSSMIAYRLHHPDAAVRKFSEEFLKQWHRDSSLHGKDQIPLSMLLWRTPGYFPAVLGDEFRTRGGNLLWKNDHGK